MVFNTAIKSLTKTEIGTKEGTISLTDLNVCFWGRRWKDFGLKDDEGSNKHRGTEN